MKKKVALLTFLSLLLFSTCLSFLSTELSSSAIVTFQLATSKSFTFTTFLLPPQFSNMCGYDVITMPTCGVTTDVGKPMLPVKIVPVLLPPDVDVEKIELTMSQKEDLLSNYRVFPVQPPVADVESRLPEFVKPDFAVYDSDKAYPGVLFENSGVSWMQGYKILNVKIFPVQYFPRDGKLTYYKTMEFTVTVVSNGLAPSRNTFSDTKDTVSKIVANPEKADVWVASSASVSSTSSIDYVIITSPSLQDEFQALADWKIENGISAGVYSTTWIYDNYPGVDDQQKIRNFLTAMYNNYGTSIALLGGDYDIVPPRYIYMEDCLDDSREAGGGLTAHYKATDYYYACLDGNWDPDGDGKYLEQTDTDLDGTPETCVEPIPDFYPEVYVGRMPASSETDAEFLVNRTINYEKYPQPGDWRNKAMLLGAISNYYNEDGKGWSKTDDAKEQEWVKDNLLTPREYNVTTMYEKDGLSPNQYACTYPLTQSNVQSNLSSGCWIMSTAGHGSVQAQWRKIWDSDDGDRVPESDEIIWTPFIDSTTMTLSNGEKLPQVYMDACFNGKFDDTSYDCVAEWLVKLSGGGAIGVTAASRISYYYIGWQKGLPYNQELLCLFWQEFFNATNEHRPGKALYESKLAYYLEGFDMTHYASKKNHLIYNLLGDPDLYMMLPTFSIKPAVQNATAGPTLCFRLMAYNIIHMNSWTVRIEWDPANLTVDQPPLQGDALNEGWMTTTFTWECYEFNNTGAPGGYLNISCALSGDYVDWTVSFDKGLLAIFYLEVLTRPPEAGTTIHIASAEYVKGPSSGFPITEDAVVYPPGLNVTVIEWLTHWTSVSELEFWDQCIAEFEAENPDIHVVVTGVDFSSLYNIIVTRHVAGEDPDLVHMHAMWVPRLVTAEILSEPPADVQTDVKANWTAALRDGVTFWHTVWGYPTEYNSWALVWNKKIFAEAGLNASKPPTTWGVNQTTGLTVIGEGELEQMALNCTTYAEYGMNRSGFYPVFGGRWIWPEPLEEEERSQFMSLLWSNGGEYVDLDKPTALFNSTEGDEVLELYSWARNKIYDPYGIPGGRFGWESWDPAHYEIAMMILPSWFSYIRDAMGPDFNNQTLGIAPIPLGPHGLNSTSLVSSWVSVVTKKAWTRRDYVDGPTHAEAAWTFLKWINEPKPKARSYGAQPEAEWVTPMGDFLVYDGCIPSRKSDQENFPMCSQFWYKDFIEIGKTYGRSDTYFRTSEEVQEIVFNMIEAVATYGQDPEPTKQLAAAKVNHFLPIPGDIHADDVIDIFDIVMCAVAFGSKPGDPNWDLRADIMPLYGLVDIFDLVRIAINFGRTPPPDPDP